VSYEQTQPREVSDAQIRAMLEAFAGPDEPLLASVRPRRRSTRRTVLLLAAGLLVVGLAVPGALALLGKWESPNSSPPTATSPRRSGAL
jgi:hypothetical protein